LAFTSFVAQTSANSSGPEIQEVAQQLQVITTLKNPLFEDHYDKMYRRLFRDLKADWNNTDDKRRIEALFVKTAAYKEVQDQLVYFHYRHGGSYRV
jgi:hypothetical protein